MSTQTRQHSINTTAPAPKAEVDTSTVLANARANTNLLFATAAKNFEATRGDSQEFVKYSRQTGGQ